jgi:Raf kinase inhibitor-like YbhB/YbcL family protein
MRDFRATTVSLPLAWTGAPVGTRSFALTCLDPDAPSGTFVHWLAWDIPAAEGFLAEGEAQQPHVQPTVTPEPIAGSKSRQKGVENVSDSL